MLDQPLADDAPRADDDVQHALRQARLERDPLELERRQRRQLGGLEHDRVPGCQRRRDLPRRDRQREVPGHDQADDAQRLAERHVDAAGDGDRVAQQPLGGSRVVVEDVRDETDLAACVADRLADVTRLERRQLLRVSFDRFGDAAEQRRAVGGVEGTPRGERLLRTGDRRVGVLDAGMRELGEHLLGRRLDDPQDSFDARRHQRLPPREKI